MSYKLKLLQLTRKVPWPFNDGESMAIRFMLKGMDNTKIKIDLLSMNTTKHYVNEREAQAALSSLYQKIDFVPLDNSISLLPLIGHLLRNNSYHIARFNTKHFKNKLIQYVEKEQPEIVQLESLFMVPYVDVIRKYSNAKIVLRAHNVEWQIWKRIADTTKNPIKKVYLNIAWRQLRRYEIKALGQIDALVPISPLDAQLFLDMGYKGPLFYFPIGIESRSFNYKEPLIEQRLLVHFIGSLDWIPNQEGITWFIKDIWPILQQHFPSIFLKVAGKNTPDSIRRLGSPTIEIIGEVPDASSFVQAAPVSIVPLLSGGGMRAKIIEAMALGSIVISTRLGAEGIPAKHLEHILIADTPQEFNDAFRLIIEKPDKAIQISKNARILIDKCFDAQRFGTDYLLFLQNLKVNC